jgi:hypothetical protein
MYDWREPSLAQRRNKNAAIESAMGLSGWFRPVISMVKAADPREAKGSYLTASAYQYKAGYAGWPSTLITSHEADCDL